MREEKEEKEEERERGDEEEITTMRWEKAERGRGKEGEDRDSWEDKEEV